jgi:2-keto-4-pentenoate hydratase/2-oxohepta-3-ene-1,7-dioic acid hydratase in catechol pathway
MTFRGKSADTHGPCGPWVVTADEIADPHCLTIETIVGCRIPCPVRVAEDR